jgi:hypothetical protein
MAPEQLEASVSSWWIELERAEDALASLLRDLTVTARAEKTTIGTALQTAIDNVRAARRQLGLLEKLARNEDEPT